MAGTGTTRNWDDATRDLAYQVWAFVAGRSLKGTQATLRLDHDVDVPHRTLADWTTRYQWAARADADLLAIAPDIDKQTIGELILGKLEAARCLRRAVREGVTKEERPSRDEIMASIALLDRTGHSPLNRAPAPSLPKVDRLPASVDLASLPIDEVLAMQAEMIDTLMQERERSTSRSA